MLTLLTPLGIPEWSKDHKRGTGWEIEVNLDAENFENSLYKCLTIVLVFG